MREVLPGQQGRGSRRVSDCDVMNGFDYRVRMAWNILLEVVSITELFTMPMFASRLNWYCKHEADRGAVRNQMTSYVVGCTQTTFAFKLIFLSPYRWRSKQTTTGFLNSRTGSYRPIGDAMQQNGEPSSANLSAPLRCRAVLQCLRPRRPERRE